jgi:DNA-binding XRE family transcriptional regulator
MNKEEFMIQMLRNKDTRETIAKVLKISKTTLSRKLNETGSEFTRTEITTLKEYWNLTTTEVDNIFFNLVVS